MIVRRVPLERLAVLVTVALLGALAATAQSIAPLPGKNLALGKTAAFSVDPNYSLCAGGDETDLTDGKFWQPDNPARYGFWGDRGTVGWMWPGTSAPGALITLDLGAVSAIAAVGFDAASGAAQVTFPAAVLVYVSDDRTAWHFVTDLINEAIPQDRFLRHRFVAGDLGTRGRYVGLYVIKGGFYSFVDEVEVLAGDGDPARVTFPGEAIAHDRIDTDAAARATAATQKNASLYFIQAAREQKPDAVTAAALDALQARAVATTGVEDVDFSRGLPYTALDLEVCKAMGAGFSRQAAAPLTVWAPEPSLWSNTSPFARPTVTAPALALHADMMTGELEPVAFNLSNNTAGPLQVDVQIGDLGAWSAASVEKRITTHVLSSGFLFFDDALTPFGNAPVTVPPGMTRQVWLILNARDVAAGDYRTEVTVAAAGRTTAIPLTVKVFPVAMPARPTYLSQTWGYFTWKPAQGFERQAAAEMERSYETAQVVHHPYIPWPSVDPATKKLVRPLAVDFAKLDELIARRPYVRQWLLWTGFEFGNSSLNYHQANDMPAAGTPEHEAVFKEWVRQIRDHMAGKGFGTGDWAFYWVDEPGDDAFLKLVVPASKLAKEVDPTILVWEDHQVSLAQLQAHPDAIDIHCCPLEYYRNHPDTLAYVVAGKHQSCQYECASSKASDPHRYYRLHHLSSVALGLDGAGMWVWGDDGGQFSDYAGPHTSYGMVYATAAGPITGKRREAWREGIEDVELFRHLRTAAAKTGDAALKALYDDGLKQILKPEKDFGQNSGTVADLMAVRLRLLQTLAAAPR
jgi:hypothetical protein